MPWIFGTTIGVYRAAFKKLEKENTMKKQLLTVMMMVVAMGMFAIASPLYAQGGQNGHGNGDFGGGANGPGEFIDEDGDGFNDLAPDADGDGIPNYADEDYIPEGNGQGNGPGEFVDEDGDGYNDNAPDEDGDGIPNYADDDFVRPQDGTGTGGGFGGGNGSGNGAGGHGRNGPGDGSGVGSGNGPGNGECIVDPAEPVQGRIQINAAH